jgi:hypothetical protein
MRVKIVTCDDDTIWYYRHIGEEFEVIPCDFNESLYDIPTRKYPEGTGVFKKDCEIIEAQPSFSLPPDYVVVENVHVVTADGKRYRLVPEEDKPPVSPVVNEPELNTFEDCWKKIRPSYFINLNNEIECFDMASTNGEYDHSLSFHLPTESNCKQIQAAIKLFVIQYALNDGYVSIENSHGGYSVYFDGALLRVEQTNPHNSDTRSPYIFKTFELAQKSIDIGKDIWRTYFGL